MLSTIVGCIWVLLGLLWTFKPEMLKNRIKRKMTRTVKWTVLGFVIFFGFMIAGSVIKASGIWPKVIGILGLIIVIKLIMIFISKTSEKAIAWCADRPLIFFRIWGISLLVMGLMLVFV